MVNAVKFSAALQRDHILGVCNHADHALITGIVLVAIGLGALTLLLMYIYWIIDDMKAIFGK